MNLTPSQLALIVFTLSAFALSTNVSSTEFDYKFINGGTVDNDTWNQVGVENPPGRYLVDLYLNGEYRRKSTISIANSDAKTICFPLDWLSENELVLNRVFFKEHYDGKNDCLRISDQNDSDVSFDVAEQALRFEIPQAGLQKREIVTDWDYGTNAIRANYMLSTFGTADGEYDFYGSSTVKANVEKWIIDSSLYLNDSENEVDILSASRALKSVHADLVIGKTYGGGDLIDSTSMFGFGLASNKAMVANESGYTPTFTGVSVGYSRVILRQNGSVIYSEIMPPGPFIIDNVGIVRSGDITMTIEEEDGTTKEQVYPITLTPGMLSDGETEYDVRIGIRDDSYDQKLPGVFTSVNLGYGIDELSLRANLLAHQKYFSGAFGIENNLGVFGTLSLSNAYVYGKYDDGRVAKGNKSTLSISKSINGRTGLNLRGTYYDNERYTSFSQFEPWDYEGYEPTRLHGEFNISVSHRFSDNGRVYFSFWDRRYYDLDDRLGLSLSLSTTQDEIKYRFGANHKRNGYSYNTSLSASVSIPFSVYDSDYISSTTIGTSGNNDGYVSTSISSSHSKDIGYSISHGRDFRGNEYNSSIQATYRSNEITANGRLSNTKHGTTGSASVAGSAIYIPESSEVVLSDTVSSTVVIAKVKNIAGAKFLHRQNETDANGNVIIPVVNYKKNNLLLDSASVPNDIELLDTSLNIIPTEGAVVYKEFDSLQVMRFILRVKKRSREYLRNGTWAYDLEGKPLGFVSHKGLLVINALEKPAGIRLSDCRLDMDKVEISQYVQEVICE